MVDVRKAMKLADAYAREEGINHEYDNRSNAVAARRALVEYLARSKSTTPSPAAGGSKEDK